MSSERCYLVWIKNMHSYGYWYPESDNETHCYVLVNGQLIWLLAQEFAVM